MMEQLAMSLKLADDWKQQQQTMKKQPKLEMSLVVVLVLLGQTVNSSMDIWDDKRQIAEQLRRPYHGHRAAQDQVYELVAIGHIHPVHHQK